MFLLLQWGWLKHICFVFFLHRLHRLLFLLSQPSFSCLQVSDVTFVFRTERLLKMSLEELREFLQERISQTFFHSDDVVIEQLQASMMELRKMKLDLPPPGTMLCFWFQAWWLESSVTLCLSGSPDLTSGKPEEFPRRLLGEELLDPVQPSRRRPSSDAGFPRARLSLHIISQRLDSISLDQSPSKDPRDLDAMEDQETQLPSPDPIIIHSQAPPTPDDNPLMGPPPY